MSDTILSGENGALTRGLDGRLFSEDLKVTVERAAAATRRVDGWSGTWGLPREQAIAIASGSVYHLHCGGDVVRFQERLKELESDGIGLRRNEGFGWVAVNPAWLFGTNPVRGASIPEPTSMNDAGGWPNLGISIDEQQRIVNEASDLAARLATSEAARQRLIDLASFARRVGRKEEVLTFLHHMANRTHPRAWNEVEAALSASVRERSFDQIRFMLSAAVILSPKRD